ncbi:MAG: glycerol-3-phosphate 1-O-acyltransferase PlsY [Bacillota bacterium]|jgi:glycerol-3-phosphate acyltransferase PlsY
MFALLTALVLLIAYGLGSLSFSYIITKKLTGEDIRTKGSGNAGFTNAMRVLPKKWGILVFVLDVLKGAAAVIIGRLLLEEPGAALALLFVIIGHMYPFWMQFRGGKGIAAGFGATLAFDWRMALVLLIAWAVVLLITNYVSAGSIAGGIALAVSGMCYHWDIGYAAVFIISAVLVIYKHKPNIERILKGTESKVFKNRKWNPLERR